MGFRYNPETACQTTGVVKQATGARIEEIVPNARGHPQKSLP
jgi:hypothetical protein